MDTRADAILRDQARLASDRSNFELQWEEIAERVMPRSAKLFFSRGFNQPQGEKKTEHMLDSTAAIALERYAAVVASLTTPQNSKWHRLRATDASLNRKPRVKLWFDEVTDILFKYRTSPRAGFYGQQAEICMSLGAFGSGINYIDWSEGDATAAPGLRYRMIHMAEAYLRENHQGVIDTLHRKFPLSARQAAQMQASGLLDRIPEDVRKCLEKEPDKQFTCVQCVKPNEEYDAKRKDWRGRPYVSYFVFEHDKSIAAERGYFTFPFAVGRNVVAPGETYGRSPAMTVLPNIKVLNEQKRTVLKMGHRLVDPVLLAFDDGVLDSFSLRPGAVNPGGINAQGQKMVQRLDDNVGQLAQAREMMDQERMVINDAFLVTLFQILVETPQMTATEVLERTREKSMLLAPTMGRFQNEYLGPLIEREVDLLARAGVLPPMPPELREAAGDYKVEFDSPLSRAMRAEEAAGFNRWAEGAIALAQVTQDPAPLDWIDVDTAMPELAEIHAVPARWVAAMEKVEAKRAGRQQAASAQQMIDAGPSAAAVLKATQDARP